MSMKSAILLRLEQFLESDKVGYRRLVLDLFLSRKEFTVDDIYEDLSKTYTVTRNKVASMIGYIHSKIGILSSHKESYKTPIVYRIKDEYVDTISTIVQASA
ncbi:MAG: DUF2551 domain-containing protein [Methanosarcinaceae archaeon]|nr:DUF2551 domain-containing protein [Methanosarcinaceae archaeon]